MGTVAVDAYVALRFFAVTPSRSSNLWLLLPALVALLWFAPVLGHGFRSDDFLTVYYWDRDGEAVRWGRVFEEWVRPWFGVRDLYRPLVSLSFGANYALSVSPIGFHLLNVLLLAGTAMAIAATAARLAPARPRSAGLVAGLLVVLHPAAVEPTAWIAARTTGLQVFWSAIAYWSFLRWRDGDGGRGLPLAAVVLACASKEGAVLLPFSLVALDLVRGSRPHWRTHLPFFLLVGAYLVFRRVLLGWFTTAEEGHTLYERIAGASALLRQLLLPPLGGEGLWGGLWLVGPIVLIALGALGAGSRRLWWCLPWAALLLSPGTTHVQIRPDELAGRFVFDAVPALALFCALSLAAWPRMRWLRAGLVVGAVGIAVALGGASRAQLRIYGDQDRLIHKVQQELLAKAADAVPGRPFGVVGLPKLPLLQPMLWGFLTQRPFAPKDLQVVGMDNMLTRDPAAPTVFTDATAVHALVANGAGFGRWDGATESLVPMSKPPDEVVEFARDPANARRFVPPRLLPATAVAAIEIVCAAPTRRMSASILGNLQGDYEARPFASSSRDPQSRWWLDTTRVLPWLVAATLGGGPAGIELELDDQAPPQGVQVRAHSVLPTVALGEAASTSVARADLAGAIGAWPKGSQRASLVLYLLLPTGLYSVPVVEGAPLTLPAEMLTQIDFVCDVLGPCRVHWFWQSSEVPGAGSPQRSTFATCVVR